MVWIIRCEKCGNERILYVSYNIKDMDKIYLYCPYCKRNTFNKIIRWEELNE